MDSKKINNYIKKADALLKQAEQILLIEDRTKQETIDKLRSIRIQLKEINTKILPSTIEH